LTQLTFVTEVAAVDNDYHRFVAYVLQQVTDAINAFKLLELPNEVVIKFRTTRFDDDTDDGVSVAATCVNESYIEMITSAACIKYLVESFIHELVHVEQGHIGALRATDNGKGWLWYGHFFPAVRLPHNEYLELPWEREAFREQKVIWRRIKPFVRDYLDSENEETWLNDSAVINVVN
jgi:hypothetical protein